MLLITGVLDSADMLTPSKIVLESISLCMSMHKLFICLIFSFRSLPDDPTQLIGTLHVTDACGVVSLMYGLLLHQGGRSAAQAPPKLSQTTEALTVAATTLLHNLASLDLMMFQVNKEVSRLLHQLQSFNALLISVFKVKTNLV